MSDEASKTALIQSVEHVLEVACFANVCPTTVLPSEQDFLTATVHFRGSRSGLFRLSIESVTARKLAAQFLGETEPDSLRHWEVADTVCELGKMICGHLLSGADPSADLLILTPEIEYASSTDGVEGMFSVLSGYGRVSVSFN